VRVPVVDLGAWWDGTHTGRGRVAAAVDEALRDVGFLLVANHGIAAATAAGARESARAFFSLPSDEKARYRVDAEAYRGWSGPGSQSNAASYGIETPPDLKETLSVGPVDLPDDPYHRAAGRWFAPNRLPADPPDIAAGLAAWYRAAAALSHELLGVFEVALGLPAEAMRRHCERATSILSVNRYPSYAWAPPAEGQFRAGPHTDFGTLTVLDREAGIGGLQIQDDAGEWHDAPVVDDCLTVNIGDLMALWTSGRWRSTRHRVLPPPAEAPSEELMSLIFFHDPDHDAVIEPLDGRPGDAVVAGDYLLAKLAALEVAG
jgi:isopenicillin N synthase-like dioxygenase